MFTLLVKVVMSPRSSKEVAEMFHITGTVMTKGVKKCQEIIHMNKSNRKRLTNTQSIKPEDFIERFCNKLKIEEDEVSILKLVYVKFL